VAKKKRTKRKSAMSDEGTIPPRDPLLAYKKPQLVERLHTAQRQLLETQQQLAVNVGFLLKVRGKPINNKWWEKVSSSRG
jgi:hypothetical protein